MMKKFLAILILIFTLQTPSQADDIRDFQIEGMSVGDSLLDYFDESEIKKSLQNSYYYPKSKKFKIIMLKATNSDLYSKYDIHIKNNDKNYIIYSLKGRMKISIDKCLNKRKSILNEIENIFSNALRDDYTSDYSKAFGKSKAHITDFKLTNGSVRVWCVEWDHNNEKVKSGKWTDGLNVSTDLRELLDFITNEAY